MVLEAEAQKKYTTKVKAMKLNITTGKTIGLLLAIFLPVVALAWGPFEGKWCSTRPDGTCTSIPPANPGDPLTCTQTTYSGCKDCGGGIWYCASPAEGDTSCSTTVYTGVANWGNWCYCNTAGVPSLGPTGCTN